MKSLVQLLLKLWSRSHPSDTWLGMQLLVLPATLVLSQGEDCGGKQEKVSVKEIQKPVAGSVLHGTEKYKLLMPLLQNMEDLPGLEMMMDILLVQPPLSSQPWICLQDR